jgi:hypothetical protein
MVKATGYSNTLYPVFRRSLYSEPPNTGLSGIRLVIFRTLFVSGFLMDLAAILLKTILKPDKIGQKRYKTGQKVRVSNGRTI